MKIFFKYLVYQKGKLGILAMSFSVIYIIMYLEKQSISSVNYALLISVFFFMCFLFIGFAKFIKRDNQIETFKNSKPYYDVDMPKALSYSDEKYQSIIEEIRALYLEEKREGTLFKEEILDYYTTWIHQIKTPISVMSLMLEEYKDESGAKLRSELFKIEAYSEMALAYLRLDDQVSDFLVRRCKVDDIIRGVLRKHAQQFIIKKLSLSYEGTEEVAVIDSKWLSLLIEQLISNSIKYTSDGGITITVSNNKIHIKDTGMGISEEDIPRIFDKGYTGYNGRLEEKSTGLGLYLADKIAKKIGCKIEVASTLGKGSCFTVVIEDRISDFE